jgi:hypothetical protein
LISLYTPIINFEATPFCCTASGSWDEIDNTGEVINMDENNPYSMTFLPGGEFDFQFLASVTPLLITDIGHGDYAVVSTPLPATLPLLAFALSGLAMWRRRARPGQHGD